MFTFTAPSGKHIILFGDVHFSYNNSCPLNLWKNHTISVNALIQDSLVREDAKLIAEYPFINDGMRSDPELMWYCDRVEKSLLRNASPGSQISAVLHRVIGIPSVVTGMLSKLFCLVHHRDVIPADIRSEPNVNVWDNAMHNAKSQEAKQKIARAFFEHETDILDYMTALLLRDDSIVHCKRIFKNTPVAKYFTHRSTGGHHIHEMRRAYLALSTKSQAAVNIYSNELRRSTKDLFQSVSGTVEDAIAVIQTVQAYCMDMYIACILAELLESPNGPTLIFLYAGDFHVEATVTFLQRFLKRAPQMKHHVQQNHLGVQRCIKLKP